MVDPGRRLIDPWLAVFEKDELDRPLGEQLSNRRLDRGWDTRAVRQLGW
jgi:hypothetical protein